MSVSEKSLTIDIPVKLTDVKVVLSVGALQLKTIFQRRSSTFGSIKDDIAGWNAESQSSSCFTQTLAT